MVCIVLYTFASELRILSHEGFGGTLGLGVFSGKRILPLFHYVNVIKPKTEAFMLMKSLGVEGREHHTRSGSSATRMILS